MSKLRNRVAMIKKADAETEAVAQQLEEFRAQLENLAYEGEEIARSMEGILGAQASGSFKAYIIERLKNMAGDREMFTFADKIDELMNMED